jgi:hypothetical protein
MSGENGKSLCEEMWKGMGEKEMDFSIGKKGKDGFSHP